MKESLKKPSTTDDGFSGAFVDSSNLSTESYYAPGTNFCTDTTTVAKATMVLPQVAAYLPGERTVILNSG